MHCRPRGHQGLATASLQAIAFFLLTAVAVSASASFIADHALVSDGWTGRSLLQAKQSCPVNFEFMNYTVIVSRCKGPKYNTTLCCRSFVEFACPYAEELNDLTNDCASTMFSYINLYGNYPPGLFANLCKDSKRGLECPPEFQAIRTTNQSSSAAAHRLLPLVVMLWFFSFLFT